MVTEVKYPVIRVSRFLDESGLTDFYTNQYSECLDFWMSRDLPRFLDESGIIMLRFLGESGVGVTEIKHTMIEMKYMVNERKCAITKTKPNWNIQWLRCLASERIRTGGN